MNNKSSVAITKSSDNDSMIGDKYVVVRRSDLERGQIPGLNPSAAAPTVDGTANNAAVSKTDEKALVAPPLIRERISSLLHPEFRRSRKTAQTGGLIKVILWQKISQNQSTTALVTASALQPSSALSWSDFASVYDEARCIGVEIHTAALAGTVSGFDTFAVAFDPGTTGNAASVANVLEHKYHVGPIRVAGNASGAPSESVASKTGFWTIHAKTVKQFVSSVSADSVGSNWYPTTTGLTPIIGYMKPYVENNAGGTQYLNTWVGYHMEFKYRS
jgi:hypothetical protein